MNLRLPVLALLPLALGFAQPQDPAAAPTAAPLRVVLPDEGVTLPLMPGMRLPTVEVYVGEAGPFLFIVEWAGNILAVSNRVREEAGLETVARSEHGNDTVAIPHLDVGDALFEELFADVHAFFDESDHDGALGLNVFRELVGTLDFPAQELRLSRTPLPDPEQVPDVMVYSPGPGGTPRVPISLAGKPFQAVLDTAAEEGLIIEESFLDELPIRGELRAGGVIMTPGMGRLETREGRVAGDLVVGSARSTDPTAVFHRMREAEILLGGGFLRDYALTLDQGNRRLRLTPASAAEPEAR